VYLREFGECFIQNVGSVVEKKINESKEELSIGSGFTSVPCRMSSLVIYVLALLRQTLFVNVVCPNTLDDLEDLVSDVKLIVELGMSTSRFDL
jgi:hypothetical protein